MARILKVRDSSGLPTHSPAQMRARAATRAAATGKRVILYKPVHEVISP